MLFPGSRIWYEGSAADLAALTEEIKSTAFSGHIVLEFQDSIDVVICVGGEFLKVIEKIGRRLVSTKKYREIWGKCQIKPGRMTVFELHPALAQKIRGLRGRRLLCSGTAATGCDLPRQLAARRDAGFTGFLDGVSPRGKLLLDYEGGKIVGCYYTEYEGLTFEGLGAFAAWHRGFLEATHPTFLFLSETGGAADAQLWDEILMDYAEQIPLPLRSSLERLERAIGRAAAPGELLFSPGSRAGTAFYILAGRVELLPAGAGPACGSFGPGSLIGLPWAFGSSLPESAGRAAEPTRFLPLTRADLVTVFHTSPTVAARCVRDAVAALLARRARLAAYREDPRLHEIDREVREILARHGAGTAEGFPAAELFAELTHRLPLSLPQIDALFRRLAALGGIRQAGGRIALDRCEP